MTHDTRYLLVTADDFGIGPGTSRGILDLAALGRVTSAVLLVNSPYAEQAVQVWRQTGSDLELGWHPCLTLDSPVLPAGQVPSLVDSRGHFHRLGGFMRRLWLGRIRSQEIATELQAQLRRFIALVGRPPSIVNAHHHIHVFSQVGRILRAVLKEQQLRPYLRRVREPWTMLAKVPGAWLKRALLSWLGRRQARRQAQDGLSGNDWLAGITAPRCVADPQFLARWLSRIPGRIVELTCHPGHADETLQGRDATDTDGQRERRVQEWRLLHDPRFPEVCRLARFTLIRPSELLNPGRSPYQHAA